MVIEITVDEVKIPAYKPNDETAIPFTIAGETCICSLVYVRILMSVCLKLAFREVRVKKSAWI